MSSTLTAIGVHAAIGTAIASTLFWLGGWDFDTRGLAAVGWLCASFVFGLASFILYVGAEKE